MLRLPRRSITVRVQVDDRPTRTRHPDAVALEAGVKLAAATMLLVEGLERVEERHACFVEYALLDDLGRLH